MIRGGKLPRVFAFCVLLMMSLTLLFFHPDSLHTLSSPHKPLWNYLFTNISQRCLRSPSEGGWRGVGNAIDCIYDSAMSEGCSNGKCSAMVKAKASRHWELVKNLLPPGVSLSKFNKFLHQQASFPCTVQYIFLSLI